MKHHHPLHNRPSTSLLLGYPRFFIFLLAAGALTSPEGLAQQTYDSEVYLGYSDSADTSNVSSSGYTYHTSNGTVNLVAQGLTLDHPSTDFGADGFHNALHITNVSDITGGGIQMGRYLSMTFSPQTVAALAGYSGAYTVALNSITSQINTEAGEHFEIRTSIDNFATTFGHWSNAGGPPAYINDPDFVGPGLTVTNQPGRDYVLTNGSVITTNTPLEIRLYTWYDSAGGDGLPCVQSNPLNPLNPHGTSGVGIDVTITTLVPEPSVALLSGTAGLLPLLRRRRRKD